MITSKRKRYAFFFKSSVAIQTPLSSFGVILSNPLDVKGKMSRFSASALVFVLLALIIPSPTVSALSKQNHPQFLTKTVSRVEQAVHKLSSIFGLPGNSDVKRDAQPKLWAVLVAGSNGYYNYRHQVLYKLGC